jgi:hypothetical protein
MTVLTELNALTLTANAKAVVSAKGADVNALLAQAKLNTSETTKILKQLQSLHPSGGGDAANLTAIGTIIAELA